MNNKELLERLQHPGKKLHMVLDTDTYNEVDDQFALAYAVNSPNALHIEAVYAAPFLNHRSCSPEDGMQKSYEEILRVLGMFHIPSQDFVFHGSRAYLRDIHTPQESDAARDLVKRALSFQGDSLYVVGIGALTNIASAILMEPKIINRIVVVWLGGNAFHWKDTDEFNLKQDIYASRIIFDSGVPLIHIPCMGVASHLLTTVPELEYYLKDRDGIGTYLTDIVKGYCDQSFGWSKVIWDIAAIAWLVNPEWVPARIVHSPIVTDQLTWSFDDSRHFIKSAIHVDRDQIFADFFRKLR